MTLDDFVIKFTGKRPDYDNAYGAQCVDLIKLYTTIVIGSTALKGNAVDLAKNPQPADYEYKWNAPFYIPPAGAIAIWNENVGEGYGHAAIVLKSSLMKFTSLDLNWPKGAVVQQITHNYKDVKGFLIPKPRANVDIYNELVDEVREITKKYKKL